MFIEKYYPKAISILDFYHVTEKIGDFAEKAISKEAKKQWIKRTINELLKDGGKRVIKTINKTEVSTKKGIAAKEKIWFYLNNNTHRMKYPEYDKKGYYIGNGFMESAHNYVIQNRMKRSGIWSSHRRCLLWS